MRPAAPLSARVGGALVQGLLQSTAAVVLVVDDGLRVTTASPGAQLLLGWDDGALTARGLEELIGPLTPAVPVGELLRAGPVADRWPLRTPEGALRSSEVTWAPAVDAQGRLTAGVLVAFPVGADGDPGDEHVHGAEQFQLVFDRSPTAMAVVGLAEGERGRFLRVNAAMEAFTGRCGSELLCSVMADVLHPAELPAHRGYLRSAAESGLTEPDGVLRRFVHADGGVRLARKSTALVTPGGARAPSLLVQLHDVTAMHAAQEALTRAALHDPLTGLPNRALFADRLDHAVAAEARSQQGLTLLYADLDGFKPVNDQHGHQAGDAVLVEVAARLRAGVREGDTVARLGGDEFAVICPALAREDAPDVVARLEACVARPFQLPSGAVIELGVSVGSASAVGRVPAEELVRAADSDMYRVKDAARTGR